MTTKNVENRTKAICSLATFIRNEPFKFKNGKIEME